MNWELLDALGLGDEYLRLSTDPYFSAGRGGGSAASLYLSARMFLSGLSKSTVIVGGSQVAAAETGLGQLRLLVSGGLPSLQISISGEAVLGGVAVVESAAAAEGVISAIAGKGGRGIEPTNPISKARLPQRGRIRYVPPRNWKPNQPLPRGPNGGYIDRFGNEWVKGPSRTPGDPFEWDVILSQRGKAQLGYLSRDGVHVNVSLKGEITH